MRTGKYVECGYEFVYEAEIMTSVGVFTEIRSLFIPQEDFDTALEVSNRIISEAEMDEGCTSARPISLALKKGPRMKEE